MSAPETESAARPRTLPWMLSLLLHAGLLAAVIWCGARAVPARGPQTTALIAVEAAIPATVPPAATTTGGEGAPPPSKARIAGGSARPRAAVRSPRPAAPMRVREEAPTGAVPAPIDSSSSLGTDLAALPGHGPPGGGGTGTGGQGDSAGARRSPAITGATSAEACCAAAPVRSKARAARLIWPTQHRSEDEGQVFIAQVTVDEDGYVVGVRMTQGMGGRAGERAETAVWTFRYDPARNELGRPIRTRIEQPFMLK